MIFEVFKSGSNNLWYFHLKVEGNNEIVAASEGYHNREDVETLHEKYFPMWTWREREWQQ
jgi:hypothetical protein